MGAGSGLRLSTVPDRDRRGDSPAWSGRGSRPSRRTSGPANNVDPTKESSRQGEEVVRAIHYQLKGIFT